MAIDTPETKNALNSTDVELALTGSDATAFNASLDHWLDVALEDSFPCSDPMSSMRAD